MVPSDYQEFANRRRTRIRDNSVICGLSARDRPRNQPGVARLPRRRRSTKAEPYPPRAVHGQYGGENHRWACRLAAAERIAALWRFRRRVFGTLVDHLVDNAEVACH